MVLTIFSNNVCANLAYHKLNRINMQMYLNPYFSSIIPLQRHRSRRGLSSNSSHIGFTTCLHTHRIISKGT